MIGGDLSDQADRLAEFAREVLGRVEAAGLTIVAAESCTGGLLASLCTDIEGLGRTFERGFVTYSDESKAEMLGVDAAFIARHGAVSREVASAMAVGALANSRAGLAIAVTGFAGRGGRHDEPGRVHLAARLRGGASCAREAHYGDVGRERVRLLTARAALEMIDELVTNGATPPA